MTRTEPAGSSAAGAPAPDELELGDLEDAGDTSDASDEDAPVHAFGLPPGADPAIERSETGGGAPDGIDWGLRAHLHADGSPRIIERHLVVPPELAGLRLDHFVKTQIPRLSRTRIQGIIA